MARAIAKRFRAAPSPAQQPSLAVRRFDDGREVCLNNPLGRAEYQRRKQLLWSDQFGLCALSCCRRRMQLDQTRMTHGDWQEGSVSLLRDDRLTTTSGERINELVHKECLRAWHRAREQAVAAAAIQESANV